MENWGRESVMREIDEGMKLAKRLKKQLQQQSNINNSRFLIQEIVSCYDNALALLNPTTLQDHVVVADVPNKRKSLMSTRREEVHEDGYNWRKYGQKHILGATHPRSYYRCTHRRTQGCLAIKQVQQGEDDSRILKVVYRGKHSCVVKQNKENVGTDESQQLKPDNIAAQPLLSEPMPEPYLNLKIEDSFLNMDSFPLGDLDYLMDVDFDARFREVCDYFSLIQDSPINKM